MVHIEKSLITSRYNDGEFNRRAPHFRTRARLMDCLIQR